MDYRNRFYKSSFGSHVYVPQVAGDLSAQFIVSTGDNFYQNGITGVDDPSFIQSFTMVYDGENLKDLPWYCILGNHDYHTEGDPAAQVGSKIKVCLTCFSLPKCSFKLRFQDMKKPHEFQLPS